MQMLFRGPSMLRILTRILAVTLLLALPLLLPDSWLSSSAFGRAYFEDGYLGLTQGELRAKLGPPHAVRDRKAALRAFNYYSFEDWQNYFSKLISPKNGEDVYFYTRDGVEVQYSFSYVPDLNDFSDYPTLYVSLVDIEFSPQVPITQLQSLVPEFKPSPIAETPAFRSNIWVLVFKGSPSPQARFIVRERGKDKLDWYLAFQMFSLEGLPDYLTLEAPIDRMEISAQSIQVVRQRQQQTHEPILNPFSEEFAKRPPPPPSPLQTIPVPQYED